MLPLAAIILLGMQGGPGGTPDYLALEDAWRSGLRNGFAIASARDALRAADIQQLEARSQFLPKITPSYFRSATERGWSIDASQALPYLGGTLRAERSSRAFNGIQTPVDRSRDTSVSWSQPLLKGVGPNASLYEFRNARRARMAQERNLVLAKQGFMVEMARVYYQTLAQRELLLVARQSAERGAVLRSASEARLEVGLSNKLDVYRAQLSEAQAEQSAVQAEAALQAAIERFRFLLGRPPNDPAEPAPGEIALPDAGDAGSLEALVESALAARVDLAEMRDQIEDARRTASLLRQNLLPDISLNVRFSEERGGGPTGPLVVTNRRWESFFSASVPLQQASDIYRLQSSNLQVAASERAYEQRRYEVESEVRAAYRDLLSLARSIATQRTAVEIAGQQLRLANLRYQRGLGSNFDVVDAESNVLAARSSLVQLLASYQVARLDLDRVVGRLNADLEPGP